jgi:hypothetical protein
MSALIKTNIMPKVTPGARLLGEIITWTASGASVRHSDLIRALKEVGLDESVARELAPRHAFARACRKLSEARIIRQIAEDEVSIQFQFTQESKQGDRFSYDFETLLTLTKKTGQVHCDKGELALLAQEELDRCIAVRTGSDITRIVQKLFEREADLFPIRPQGGAYFVPQLHAGFIDRMQSLLKQLNGQMLRFPVPEGTASGDISVKEAVASGLSALIAEHEEAIASFGEDTRPDTVERAAERIRNTKFKVEAYAALLADQKHQLELSLATASRKLRQKVESLAAEREAVLV